MSTLGIAPLIAIGGGITLALILLLQFVAGITVSLPSPWREVFLALVRCAGLDGMVNDRLVERCERLADGGDSPP